MPNLKYFSSSANISIRLNKFMCEINELDVIPFPSNNQIYEGLIKTKLNYEK